MAHGRYRLRPEEHRHRTTHGVLLYQALLPQFIDHAERIGQLGHSARVTRKTEKVNPPQLA
jgi:hypothetical protein